MRLFVAIEIGDGARKRLAEAQRKLRYVNAKISWVAPQNFHFTLKFLGETPYDLAPRIHTAMNSVASEFVPFQCELRGLGQFPRVIWVGIHGETQQLPRLVSRLDEEFGQLGFQRETREFSAHLTLGRIKFVGDREGLTRLIASSTNESYGAVEVDAIHLFQSTLTPKGSIYTKHFTANLKGTQHGHQNGQS